MKTKMTLEEWRNFMDNFVAGMLGGFVVICWSLVYDIVKNKSFLWIILAPTISSLILFLLLFFILRRLFRNKKLKT